MGVPHDSAAPSVGRSAALMSALVIVSRVTGFFRTWAQAWALGAGLMASCYTVANNLPNQLYELVAGGMLVTAFLPVYMSAKERGGPGESSEYASNLLSLVTIAMGAVSLLAVAFAAQLVFLQSAGSDQSQMAPAASLLRFFAIEVLLYSLSTVVSGILNAERDYLWGAAAPVANNVIVILSFVGYRVLAPANPALAFLALALGNPLGVAVQFAMQLPALGSRGIRLHWRVDLHDPHLRDTLRIGLPTIVIMICTFVTVSVMNTYSLVADPTRGSSIQYYARLWYALPYSVFAVPLTTAMFTELADAWGRGDRDAYRDGVSSGVSQIAFSLVPFMLMLMAFASPLMSLLRVGRMSSGDAQATASYLRWLAAALPGYGICTYMQKAFSSMRRMGLFAVANVAASGTQVLFTVLAEPAVGMPAVALGSVVYYALVDGISLAFLRRELGRIGLRSLAASAAAGLAFGAMGSAAGLLVCRSVAGLLGAGMLPTIASLAAGGAVAVALSFLPAIRMRVPGSETLSELAPGARGRTRR